MTTTMNLGSHANFLDEAGFASRSKTSAGARPLVLLAIIALHVAILIYATFVGSVFTPPEPIVMTTLIAQPSTHKPLMQMAPVTPPVSKSMPEPAKLVQSAPKPVARPHITPPIVAVKEKILAPSVIEQSAQHTVQAVAALPSPPASVATATPSAQPVASPVVEPSAVSPPRFNAAYLNNPPPAYPPMARRMGEEGKVMLRVYVTPEGTAGEVRVQASSGSPLFDDAATAAVRQWRFVPAHQGENAVAGWVQVPIVFKLG